MASSNETKIRFIDEVNEDSTSLLLATLPSERPKAYEVNSKLSITQNNGANDGSFGYEQTVMFGKYTRSLSENIKLASQTARHLKKFERRENSRIRHELSQHPERSELCNRIFSSTSKLWRTTLGNVGEDWIFLALLGIIMAIISFAMDFLIDSCAHFRHWMFYETADLYNGYVQFPCWIISSTLLVLFSAGFVHFVAPQAIGSGIPEMKTILRGVVLKEYLSFNTLLAKAIGLTAVLGSGMPLGKEGPFVHIASIVATLISQFATSVKSIYSNESKNSEMLAAACAVGVACCFGSPIGGVLFSIEVTSVYFAVRNYWRGFFSAICGAITFRMLSVWTGQIDTIVPVFPTSFSMEFPFDPKEISVFALIGVCSGFGGATYVYMHRRYVLWMRGNKCLSSFLQKHRLLYPLMIALIISTLNYPPWIGQFQAAELSTHDQIHVLFSDYPWSQNVSSLTHEEMEHIRYWTTPHTSMFTNLSIYILLTFFTSILAATLPVPTGVLIPAFKVGAAFGRIIGEGMYLWYPNGLTLANGSSEFIIAPGGYATVGAAAFTGAVTHTISISVIIFEMTGQITHCIPVLIAVLIANAIAQKLTTSCYDSIILIKKLPYLPDILPTAIEPYNIHVNDFMIRDVKYIWYGMNFADLKKVLSDSQRIHSYPLVDNPYQMVLLGSIKRANLIEATQNHISYEVSKLLNDAIGKPESLGQMRRRSNTGPIASLINFSHRSREQFLQKIQLRKEHEKRTKFKFQESCIDDKTECISSSNLRRLQSSPTDMITSPPSTSNDSEVIDKGDEERFLRSISSKARRPSRFQVTTDSGIQYTPSSIHKEASDMCHDSHNDITSGIPRTNHPSGQSLSTRWREHFATLTRHTTSLTVNSNALYSWLNKRSSSGRESTIPDREHSKMTSKRRRWKSASFSVQVADEQERLLDKCLEEEVDFSKCLVDPAPFQLVEKTTLLKVHSIFSLLSLDHAYVTALGRLIGVVGLKELRSAIENSNFGADNQVKGKNESTDENDDRSGDVSSAIAETLQRRKSVRIVQSERSPDSSHYADLHDSNTTQPVQIIVHSAHAELSDDSE